jgi:putative aminopeptidase FrvX
MDLSALRELIARDSPTGFTSRAASWVVESLGALGWRAESTRKGAVRCRLGDSPRLAIAAHLDTLGAVVADIRQRGTLMIAPVGGLSLNMAEGEYVTVHTLSGETYTGTFLLDNPSTHANRAVSTATRTADGMHVRLDEVVRSADDARALGIRNGDFVCFDPRYRELPSGYIKSRFLDNKAGCFVLFELARRLASSGERYPVELFFSSYEEVGHGGTCGYSSSIEDLLVVDMGVIGDACDGEETACSICALDSSGPYDFEMRAKLVELAERAGIPYHVDVYPHYSSDGSAAWRAGNDFRVGLIGPGVAASHGVERTHRRGITATIDLVEAYVRDRYVND